MAERPRYVPSRNRRNKLQQQPRFHGAFTGGFSAGFFNTVGSKEGWQPRTNDNGNDDDNVLNTEDEIAARPFPQQNNDALRKRQRPQQRLEDFMDEQDHDEWGGPTSIRKEYKDASTAAAAAVPSKSKASATTTSTQATTGMGASTMAQELELEQQQWRNITVEPPAHVGHRLLRILGWREGNSAAYVPDHAPTSSKTGSSQNNNNDQEAKIVLSSKKLRKIQLQQQRVKIPPPKLDTCGLGYEPYQNAPEFQAYQEKRKKLAQQRAKLDHHNANNVYRVSDILGGSTAEQLYSGGIHDNNNSQQQEKQDELTSPNSHHRQRQRLNAEDLEQDAYASYETVEDFIGSKSVGGFALREDADQAYDDEDPQTLTKVSNKVRLDTEAYNDEIYEHHSSGDEDDHNMNSRNTIGQGLSRAGTNRMDQSLATTNHTKTTTNKGSDFAGVLSNFADTGGGVSSLKSDNTKAGGVTTDGRAPLVGFVLGGTFASHSMPKRYRGPDVPLSYQVTRHVFSENEHPAVLKALSRAVQLEAVDAKRRQALDEALQANAASNAPSRRLQLHNASNNNSKSSSRSTQRDQEPMAGGAFVGLTQALKKRFTSVIENFNDAEKIESGLRVPSKGTKMDAKSRDGGQSSEFPSDKNAHEKDAKPEIKLSRTTRSFAPDRILCKRFYVPVPASSSDYSSTINSGRVTESSYFQQEILQPAVGVGSENGKQSEADELAKFTQQAKSIMATMFNEDGTMKEDDLIEVPTPGQVPMDIKRSIFEPESEAEDSESENELPVVESNSEEKTARETFSEDQKDHMTEETKAKTRLEKSDKSISQGSVGNSEATSDVNETEETEVVLYKERDKKKKQKKSKRSRSRKHRRHESDSGDESSKHKSSRRRKRTMSISSNASTDLDRDSGSDRKEKVDGKRHRDHKDRRKHKHKKKKRSKRSRKEDE